MSFKEKIAIIPEYAYMLQGFRSVYFESGSLEGPKDDNDNEITLGI